jgi:hypothetical protein
MDDLRAELLNAYTSAKAPGWYAGEGEPVSSETFEEAKRFLEALPRSYAPTEVYPEPDGDLAFEWHEPYGRTVIVSFDGKGRAIFVVRFSESDKCSGQVPFTGNVSEVILFHLKRFFAHAAGA